MRRSATYNVKPTLPRSKRPHNFTRPTTVVYGSTTFHDPGTARGQHPSPFLCPIPLPCPLSHSQAGGQDLMLAKMDTIGPTTKSASSQQPNLVLPQVRSRAITGPNMAPPTKALSRPKCRSPGPPEMTPHRPDLPSSSESTKVVSAQATTEPKPTTRSQRTWSGVEGVVLTSADDRTTALRATN